MAGGRKSSVNYNNPAFNKWNLEHGSKFSIDEKKSLLRKFRKTAQDRMYRLEKSNIGKQTARNWKQMVKFDIKGMSEGEINAKIAQLTSFLASDQSTVSGIKKIRKKAIEKLQEHGIDVNEENFDEFNAFMETFKGEEMSSGQIADFYSRAHSKGYTSTEINNAYKVWSEDKEKYKKETIEMMKKGESFTEEKVESIMKRGGRRGMSAEQRREMKLNRRNKKTRNKRGIRRK